MISLRLDNYRLFITTMLGVGLAQAITLVSMPVIAKLTGPEVFGEFSFYNSLALLVCVLSSLKLEFAIFTVPWRIYPYLKLLVAWLMALNAFVLGFGVVYWIGINDKAVANNVILLGICFSLHVLALCKFEFMIQDNIRAGFFKKNAYIRVTRALIVPIVFISLWVAFEVSVIIIIISFVVGNFIPAVIFRLPSLKWHSGIFNGGVLLKIWLSCRNVIVFLVPAHFLNRYSGTAVIVLSGLLGIQVEDIAKYALIEKLIIAPTSIITSAASDVVKRELFRNPVKALINFYRFSCYTITASIFVAIIVILFSEDFICAVMGEGWAGSGEIAIAMLPYFSVLLIFSPITHTYTILNKQKYDFYWQIFHACLLTGAIVIGMSSSFIVGVWCFSFAAAISIFVSFIFCRYLILRHDDPENI
jgi:O-antigen/teichoic acid export membrane protein